MTLRPFLCFLFASSIVACAEPSPPAPAPAPTEATTPSPPKKATSPSASTDQETEQPSAPEPTWCSQQGQHDFCEDFDGPDLTKGWQVHGVTSAFATIASDRSSPHGLKVTQQPEGGGKALIVTKVTHASPTKLHLAVDMRVEAGGNDSVDPLLIQLTDPAYTRAVEGIQLGLYGDSADFMVFSLEKDKEPTQKNIGYTSLAGLPQNSWVRVAIDVDLSATTLVATASFDGVKAGEATVQRVGDPIAAAVLSLGASFSASASSSPYVIGFDNLLFDVE